MKINLVTDAKYHNLALMKISSALKELPKNKVYLNGAGFFDYTIGSWLFTWSKKVPCDYEGGPGISVIKRLHEAYQHFKPDYTLFNLDYSLGYTWSYCPRKCEFCIVPKQNNPKEHHSIWDFHDSKFKKICLLNNNTFSDLQWKETFEEIWDGDLIVRDENGYDLRLIDEDKAEALHKTKWDCGPYFSWDLMKDEKQAVEGLKTIRKIGFKWNTIHVLIGFDTTLEEDIYRCQKLHDMKFNPYPMIYENDGHKEVQHRFRRMIYARYYKKSENIEKAWREYTRK